MTKSGRTTVRPGSNFWLLNAGKGNAVPCDDAPHRSYNAPLFCHALRRRGILFSVASHLARITTRGNPSKGDAPNKFCVSISCSSVSPRADRTIKIDQEIMMRLTTRDKDRNRTSISAKDIGHRDLSHKSAGRPDRRPAYLCAEAFQPTKLTRSWSRASSSVFGWAGNCRTVAAWPSDKSVSRTVRPSGNSSAS
jgi:hypothetical protein